MSHGMGMSQPPIKWPVNLFVVARDWTDKDSIKAAFQKIKHDRIINVVTPSNTVKEAASELNIPWKDSNIYPIPAGMGYVLIFADDVEKHADITDLIDFTKKNQIPFTIITSTAPMGDLD